MLRKYETVSFVARARGQSHSLSPRTRVPPLEPSIKNHSIEPAHAGSPYAAIKLIYSMFIHIYPCLSMFMGCKNPLNVAILGSIEKNLAVGPFAFKHVPSVGCPGETPTFRGFSFIEIHGTSILHPCSSMFISFFASFISKLKFIHVLHKKPNA